MLRRGTRKHPGGFKKDKNTAKRNMSSTVCALSICSRLCIKMSYFLFVRAWAMPRILYLSCGTPFLVQTPGIIYGLKLWWGCQGEKSSRKISDNFLRGGGQKNLLEGRAHFQGYVHF